MTFFSVKNYCSTYIFYTGLVVWRNAHYERSCNKDPPYSQHHQYGIQQQFIIRRYGSNRQDKSANNH
jgi:hypothetical protein